MTLLTLFIAAAGGYCFYLVKAPLPWLLGSMLLVAISSCRLKQLAMPNSLALSASAIIGVSIGTLVTKDILSTLSEYSYSIAFMLLLQFFLVGLGTWYIRFKAKTDRVSAVLAAYPGALSQVSAMSLELKCNHQLIAINHTTRIFLVISSIPFIVSFFLGVNQPIAIDNTLSPMKLEDFFFPILLSLVGYSLAHLYRIVSPALFGPMILVAALNLMGALPKFETSEYLLVIAQVIIGASIGLRFKSMSQKTWGDLWKIHLPYGITLLLSTFAGAFIVHLYLEIPITTSLLIMAPGGLSEMILISYSLNIDTFVVASHHVIRSLVGLAVIPLLIKNSRDTKQL